ncbi:HET-domain-containing protein [Annulohypoxylon bovei var. microspora]|nr:HET-domain-containing protein [Annulohypoxylon bovei var. microspora]
MYLLDVETLTLHGFQGSDIPKNKYAILSHTWGEGEVNFQDLQAGRGPSMKGYEKIVLTCEQAKRDGYKWAWVDTCCIDKSSSAELSEAINSMYLWYKESGICYAYLVDVDTFPYVPSTGDEERQISKWFTRAWTLQELIAPEILHFYGRGWKNIGRLMGGIAYTVSDVTGIPVHLIEGSESLSQYSAAQKMSWAACRSSTRPEDIAYSLLGLFNINMPLLYGEGERAFIRLQEEIFKETDDHSLLCWTVPESSHRAWTLQSVFATSPDDFSAAGQIKGNLFDYGHPSAVTNRGLQIRLSLLERRYGEDSHLYHKNAACSIFRAALNAAECEPIRGTVTSQISILLVRTPKISERHLLSVNRYARLATPSLGRHELDKRLEDMVEGVKLRTELIYIHKTLLDWERDRFGVGGIHLQNIPIEKSLSPFSPEIAESSGVASFWGVKTVLYSGLETELCDVTTTGVPPNLDGGIVWSPIYGCVRFDFTPRQPPNRPCFVCFGVESPHAQSETHSILLAWNEDYIHFSLRPSKVQTLKFLPSKYLNGSRERRHMSIEFMREMKTPKEVWDKILDPSDSSTHKGNCWDMYGEIARIRQVQGFNNTEFILEREDPNTEAGEAAGNRLHFLIRASIIDQSVGETVSKSRLGFKYSLKRLIG